MQKLKTTWNEVAGLFVDDQMFAVAILAWLAAVWLAAGYAGLAPGWCAVTLFAGLAAILVESATRAVRR